MDEYMKLVKKVGISTVQTALYTDMEENIKLYNLDSYAMTDFNGTVIPRVTNVTLPAIASFADKLINTAGGGLPMILVKSKDLEPAAKDTIKNFLYGAFDSANNARAQRGFPMFNLKLAEHGALKKVIALRVIVKTENDKTYFDLLPLDPRNLVYRMGINGPIFTAYRTVRDAESIRDEYGDTVIKDDVEDATIWEVWTKDINNIYLSEDKSSTSYEGELIRSEPNILGYIPVVIIPLERTIYHNCKHIYRQMCRTASILKSQSMDTLFGPKEFHTPGGAEVPEEIPGTGDFTVVGVDPQEGWKNVPLNDVYQATAFMWQIETSEFQRATWAFIEYGGLEFPLSSLALSDLRGGSDQILYPLLRGMALCYRGACDMMIRQFIEGPFTATLGDDEMVAEYQASDLLDPSKDYTIKFSFKSTNVSEEGAAYQMAMVAAPFLPLKTRLEEIIKVDNAEEVMQDLFIEQAEQLFPELLIPKMVKAYEAKGKPDEAAFLKEKLDSPEPEPQGPPQPMPQEQGAPVQPPPPQNQYPPMATAPVSERK